MGLLDDFSEEEIETIPEERKAVEEEKEPMGILVEADSKHESITTGKGHVYNVNVINRTGKEQTVEVTTKLLYETDEFNRVHWKVKIGEKLLSKEEDVFRKEVEIENGGSKTLKIEVQAPDGARYGEKMEVIVEATSKKDYFLSDSINLMTIARPTVIAVKTQIGQEKNVGDYLASLAKNKKLGIFSILSPKPVRGYIFMEVMTPQIIEEAIGGIRKAKGVVQGETDINEIEHFLAPKLAVEGIAEGDIVELSAGPFKGEKARVTQIDESNDEITVELFEATVPIPVTVRGDHVRVLEKET
ncbi:MAG: transcription elongation factor Spt5 [Thermoplasmata archaeon]